MIHHSTPGGNRKSRNHFFWANSIFTRLLSAFILVVFIPSLIITAISAWSSYQIGLKTTLNRLNATAALKSDQIDMWTNEMDIGLDLLISDQDLYDIVIPLLDRSKSYNHPRLHDLFIQKLNQEYKKAKKYTSINLLDLDGFVVASTDPTQEFLDQSRSAYYLFGLQKHYITQPFHLSPDDSQWLIVIAQPVIDPQHGSMGVLAGFADISVLDSIMKTRTGMGETGKSYLVDPDFSPITRYDGDKDLPDEKIHSEGIQNAFNFQINGYNFYNDYLGKPVIGVYSWLPRLQIGLLVEQDQAEAYQASIDMFKLSLYLSLAALLLAIMVAFFVTRNISNSIISLSDTASKIAAGDLNRVAEVNRKDEIGKLAATFNHMTRQLRNLIDQLKAELIERKKVEDALRVSEDKFKYIFEYSIVGKSITSPTGEMHVNKAFAELLGYSQEEMALCKWQEISHPDDIKLTQDLLDPIFKGERDSCRLEKRYIHKDGSIIWADVSTSLRKDNNGKPLYFMTSVIDITDRKKAQNEIQVLNRELEQRVSDRTAQLEAANKELEAFAYSVSHDLRAPLRAMNGFSAVLISDYASKLDKQGRFYLSHIQEASRHMGQLIEDLLNLSRITRREMCRSQVNLSELANSIAKALLEEYPDRHVEFDIAPELIVQVDPNLIKIAFENLLNNAFKFTSQQPQARIEVGVMEKDHEQVYFVRDNGVGFDMAYANKLFSPFQRLHSPQEFPGIGIGLVTVHRIITRHGGRLWPEAAINKGATFYFTLGDGQ